MWALVRSIGLLLGSIKGWLFAAGLMPAFLTYWLGIYDDLPWSVIVIFTTIELGLGALLALVALKLYESATSHFTSRKERARIKRQIREYIDAGETMIDIPTAAALWAGTLGSDDVQRHLFFRLLKLAVDSGAIKNAVFPEGQKKANVQTKIPLDEFVSYLHTKGAI